MMKIGNILLWLTTWMSRLDRMVSPDRCFTNPFLATFLLYVFLVMGVTRDVSASADIIESLDDVYVLMLPQNKGMGLMCLIVLAAETIMLYGGIVDILTRFVIIVIAANLFYIMGLFMPLVGAVLLGLLAIAYVYMLIYVVRNMALRIRRDDGQSSGQADPC